MVVATLSPARALRRPRRADPRALIGIFLTLASLAGSIAFWVGASEARPVLVATRDLPAGATLHSADLTVAYIRMDERLLEAAVPSDMLDSLVGRQLAEPIHAQQVLARAQVADRLGLARDQVASYAWADERDAGGITVREHFRRLFVQATVSLASLRLETDQVESALELYREASELEPTDERVWLSLFRIHARRGDRPALVREERRLRAALRELVDDPDDTSAPIEPSRSLTVEFQRLLAELDVPERQPATV